MGIDFSFYAKVEDKQKVSRAANEVSKAMGAEVLEFDTCIRIDFCRLGSLYLDFKEESNGLQLEGNARTNLAGAGYHKAVVDFTDAFLEKAELQAEVEDETEYYEHRDFEKMRTENMYSWLKSMMQICKIQIEKEKIGNLAVCWSNAQYQPELMENTAYSPFGPLHIPQIIAEIEEEGIERFAQRFFLWNEKEKDAGFYLKSALSMLWEECYFMPGSRSEEDQKINQLIIKYLETAARMNPELPFPKEDYLCLCRLNEAEPISLEGLKELKTEEPIGFRKGLVIHSLGNFKITLPGFYQMTEVEREQGFDYVWYDGVEQNWHNFRFTVFSSRNGNAEFSDQLFEETEENFIEYEAGDGRGRAAFAREVIDEEGDSFYQSIAQVICENQMLFVTASFAKRKEKDKVMELLQQIKGSLKKKK